MKQVKSFLLLCLVWLGLANVAFAQTAPALTDLTSTISFTTVAAAVLAVGGLIAGFRLIKQGAMIVLRMIGWAK